MILASAISAGALRAEDQSMGVYATAADFAKYAMKLREQALLKVEPQVFVPTASRPATARFPWKTNIVTTVFWIGEQAGGNNPVPNYRSCWDRAAVQRRDPQPIQAGSAARYSVVQTNLLGAGTIGLLASLDFYSQRQSHLLRAMGRLRAVSHGSFSIRFWKRAPETESQPRCGAGRVPGCA